MRDFISEEYRPLLERYGLASFDALWKLNLPAVDDPNEERGGWSAVYRLEVGDQSFFLKRQMNHCTRSIYAPLGEPTFARELRNIRRYHARGVSTIQAVFYAERRLSGSDGNDTRGLAAILLTRALSGWRDLAVCLRETQSDAARRHRLLTACGALARTLHHAGLMHCCFYPHHIFIREGTSGKDEACLIDLEKTRPLLFGLRDRVKDLEQFLRHAAKLDENDIRIWLAAYLERLPGDPEVTRWIARLRARRQDKESR